MAGRKLGKQEARFRVAVAGMEGLDGSFFPRPGDDGPHLVRIDPEGRLEGVRQAGGRVFPADDDAVDDQGGIRRGRSRGAYFLNILHFPVPIDPQKALALEVAQSRRRILGQQGFRRSGQDQARLFRQGDEFLRNLVRAFAHQFLARFRVMGSAGSRIQDAQVVQNFRDAPQQGAGTLLPGGLFQAQGRGQSGDAVHLRLFRLFHALPGPCRKTIQETPAGFGEKRVERQGGFSGAGRAAEHDQLVGRKVQVQVPEVVLACAADGDGKVHVT